ncbi:MAG TPA: glucuronate isomerase [Oceanobacillus sp.]|nr:glucuronate isomerase [Oceanobacillus sp.]
MPLAEDRYFSPDPTQRKIARTLYEQVADLPLICPHGHVDPCLFADPDYRFGSPTELLIIPDHYIFRMLYSQGVRLETLGIPTKDGTPVENDHRKIWQIFAEHFYLFRATPTGMWLTYEFEKVFGVQEKLTGESAQRIYDQIDDRLKKPDFTPHKLYAQFNIEVLCTTDPAADTLENHQKIRQLDGNLCIRPTFRPDAVVNMNHPGWRGEIDKLSAVSGIDIHDYQTYIQALEKQRAHFKALGARATDHAALTAYTTRLSASEADALLQRGLKGEATDDDIQRFTGHMLVEMARMSVEDGLVMQLHVGSYRDHNPAVAKRFGRDMGADIPIAGEFTRSLKPLLDAFGDNPQFTLILFTLDETTYGRELAPLAGHYPALKLGPPWWFFDSLNGMRRYFDQIIETAGLYNTAGFNDDTRAFASIPARHDLWRRAACDWLAGLTAQHIIDEADAAEMARACAYDLAKIAYKL